MELMAGSSLNDFKTALARMIPGKEPDLAKFFIQIKESRPAYYVFFGVVLILVSAFCIIGGLVLGLRG